MNVDQMPHRELDEDQEYQWADDAKLGRYTAEEWAELIKADTEQIRENHRKQAEILRRRRGWR